MPLPLLRDDFAIFNGEMIISYLHQSELFPLGEINNCKTPAETDRLLLEDTADFDFGPIAQLILAKQEAENLVHVYDAVPKLHQRLFVDGAIGPYGQMAFSTLLGDCASIGVIDKATGVAGFMHCGRRELWDGLIPNFFKQWPGDPRTTVTMIAPVICSLHYELLDTSTIEGTSLERFISNTVWGTTGFDLKSGIVAQISACGYGGFHLQSSHICPFCERDKGHLQWASDQWFKKNRPGQFSPRSCVFMHLAV